MIYFANGSEAMPALATGQLEIGGGAANPATFNAHRTRHPAEGRGRPGHLPARQMGYQAIVIRKEVCDRGQGRRWTT